MRNYDRYLDTYELTDILEQNDLTEEDVLRILDAAGYLDLETIPEPL